MEVAARPVQQSDLAAAAELLEASVCAAGAERGGEVFVHREGRLAGVRDLMADPDVLVALGTLADVPLGIAVARLESIADGSLLARLEWLFVEPGGREVGVGGELIGCVRAWAEERGASRLDAYALPGNREMKNFLEAARMSARLIVMSRSLP